MPRKGGGAGLHGEVGPADGHEPGAAGATFPGHLYRGRALVVTAVNASYRLGMQFHHFISSLVRLGPDCGVFFSAEFGAGCLQPSSCPKERLVGVPVLVVAVLSNMSCGFIYTRKAPLG